MSFSLYQATVPSYLQIINATIAILHKAEAHCAENNIAAEELIQAKLADNMLPLPFQITSMRHHSKGAIEGLKAGVFSPDPSDLPTDFAGLKKELSNAKDYLDAATPEELNNCVGQPMRFEMGEMKIPFLAEEFLLSFSQPNFYFHATTAYDLLRAKGVPIGKMDFMGTMRVCS